MKFTNFISEARTAAGETAAKRGLQHVGHGYYADRSGTIVAKSEGGQRLVPVDPQEAEVVQQDAATGFEEDEANGSVEDKGEVAMTFGRFNPPTIGHQKVFDKVASESTGEYRIYPSRKVDPKQNPLQPVEKINFMKKMFPNHAEAIQNDDKMGNIFDVLNALNEEGYSSIKMIVGDDRVSEFSSLLEKYNGVAYNFEEGLEVKSAGARDPDAEGAEGMSASKMRAFAAENDLKGFAKGIPNGDESLASNLMNAVRRGMGVTSEEKTPSGEPKKTEKVTELWKIAPKFDQQGLREAYVNEEVFQMGSLVEHNDTGVQGEVVYRGTNYVIFEDCHGWRFRVWLTSLNEVTQNEVDPDEQHHSADDHSGNTWKVGTDTYRKALQDMTPGQATGRFTTMPAVSKKFSDFRKTK
ncbi:MAG: hypothetical protein CMA59_00665 [Euryarchaeota archaeon]|nr:hypothetical protein [Euryarchaeota archaeon]